MVLMAVLTVHSSWAAVSTEEVAKIEQAMPSSPVVQPAQPRKLLVVNLCGPRGFKHSSIPYWDKVLEVMAAKTRAFEVTFSSDMAVFSAETLKAYDGICFNNTTALVFTDDQKKALMDFVRSGKGLVGIHAATDNFPGWEEASHMIGGRFVKHPWTSDKTVTVRIDDPGHPLTKPFAGKAFKVTDEIYVTHPPFYGRDKQRVLMSLDMSDPNTLNVRGVTPQDHDTGISWIKPFGQGRVFYGSLGHNHPICWNPQILAHYLAGIQFALGDLKADATPLPAPKGPQAKDGVSSPFEERVQKAAAYDFGKGPEALWTIEQSIREMKPSEYPVAEQCLLRALRAGGSTGWIDFLCRQLGVVGSEASAEILIPMLRQEDTADMARYALERIGTPGIRNRVRQVLSEVPARTRVGICSTLGTWRDPDAVETLSGFLKGRDEDLRLAAIAALARIGTETAAQPLVEALGRTSGPARDRVSEACLKAAQTMAREGKGPQAGQIYKQVYEAGSSSRIRAAALAGRIETDRAQAGPILLSALRQPDQDLVVAACPMISQIRDPDQRRQLAEFLPKVPEAGTVAMLTALAQTGDRGLCAQVLSAARTEKGDAQVAAVRALGPLGDKTAVSPLVAVAASSQGELRQAARDSLAQIWGDQVDAEIVRTVRTAEAPIQRELIRAIRARGTQGASDTLIRIATQQDAEARAQALLALGELGTAQDLAAVAGLLLKAPSQELEDAVVAIGQRVEDASTRSDPVLALLDGARDPTARGAVLRVLGRLGSDKALPILLREMGSADSGLRTEAVRALAAWPGPAPMQDLWQVATTATDLTQHVLALRGYVQMVGMPSDVPAAQKAGRLGQAMAVARRADEKKLILSVLAQCACVEALDLAASALADPALKAEAGMAIAAIGPSVMADHGDKVGTLLNRVLAETDNRSLQQRINQILKRQN